MGSGNDCGIVLRHALAHAPVLHRRCIINRERLKVVAPSLQVPLGQAQGAVRMMRAVGRIPSPERCALIVMNDWGMDDDDIAEIFSRTAKWSAMVRQNAAELRLTEPVPLRLEYLDMGLRPHDPCPEELYRRAAEERVKREQVRDSVLYYARSPAGLRNYSWNGRHASFFQIGSDGWTKR